MRQSQHFGLTLKDAPREAQTTAHRLRRKPMRFKTCLRLWLLFLAGLAVAVLGPGAGLAQAAPKAKNVIVLIVDGCSAEQYTFGRWFKGAPLSFDPYRVGAIQTYIADSVIADSAPAASAFATGVRTSDKYISVGPHPNIIDRVPVPPEALRYRPVATVLEGAKLLKKSTGIVATSHVAHATPAAYMAHTDSRSHEDDIMEQAVYQGIDVVFGGGRRLLIPKELKGRRNDGENLYEYLKGWGYQIVENRKELEKTSSPRVFGMFAPSHMDPEIDRPRLHPEQPTLAEMTRKAIDLLSRDKDGFFLMVEGSQVDWACHANDPAYLLGDLLAFDQAVAVALDFAKRDGQTLVLAMSDHNTGGFSIGNHASNAIYPQMKVEAFLDPFRKMQASTSRMWELIDTDKTAARVKAVLKEGWALDITDEDAQKILTLASSYKDSPYYAIGEVLCPKYTYVGWTTHGHCGGDVPLHAFGPGKPGGVLEAPDIARVCASAMGFDLQKLTERLFVDAGQAFGDGRVLLDRRDPANPVVSITVGATTAELPVNKNLLRIGEKAYALEGVVVYAPKPDKAYIPLQAVHLVRGSRTALPKITN
jgi:alkaline phosphatase